MQTGVISLYCDLLRLLSWLEISRRERFLYYTGFIIQYFFKLKVFGITAKQGEIRCLNVCPHKVQSGLYSVKRCVPSGGGGLKD